MNSCNVGYTGPDGGPCLACIPGFYKDTNGSVACTQCPRFASSTIASSDVIQCICDPGYTGPNGIECSACLPGTWKSINGSSNCTFCERGKYSTASNATSESTCVSCPFASDAPVASSDIAFCVCNLGYTGPNGGNCTACEPGKYKDVNGTAPCANCPKGKYSVEDADISESNCTVCPQYSTSYFLGASNITECICDLGFSGPDGGLCLACEPGFYKDVNGSSPCRACSIGSFQGSENASACEICAPGYYSVGQQSVCTLCPANSFSPAGSNLTNCTCNGKLSTLLRQIAAMACCMCGKLTVVCLSSGILGTRRRSVSRLRAGLLQGRQRFFALPCLLYRQLPGL